MEPLKHDKFYHVYNRGNNHEDLFLSDDNYTYFLKLYLKHVSQIADTYAWVLMRNHFHFLVRIKSTEEIIRTGTPDRVPNPTPDRVPNPDRGTTKSPHLYFSNLFNSYSQAFNKLYDRSGTLFNRPFKRICVNSEEYLRKLVVYIHTNPVHHGFTENFTDYPWSSYQSIVTSRPEIPDRVMSHTPDRILNNTPDRVSNPVRGNIPNPVRGSNRQEVINWFDDIDNFKAVHQMKIDTELLSELLFE